MFTISFPISWLCVCMCVLVKKSTLLRYNWHTKSCTFFVFKFIFDRRITALGYWFDFCHTSISHRCTYVPSLLNFPPASHSSRLLQGPCVSSLSHTANSHWLSTLHMVVYTFPCFSLHPSHLLLPPSPSCVHKSVLYVCLLTAAQ